MEITTTLLISTRTNSWKSLMIKYRLSSNKTRNSQVIRSLKTNRILRRILNSRCKKKLVQIWLRRIIKTFTIWVKLMRHKEKMLLRWFYQKRGESSHSIKTLKLSRLSWYKTARWRRARYSNRMDRNRQTKLNSWLIFIELIMCKKQLKKNCVMNISLERQAFV
jgi:hypothetical protein